MLGPRKDSGGMPPAKAAFLEIMADNFLIKGYSADEIASMLRQEGHNVSTKQVVREFISPAITLQWVMMVMPSADAVWTFSATPLLVKYWQENGGSQL